MKFVVTQGSLGDKERKNCSFQVQVQIPKIPQPKRILLTANNVVELIAIKDKHKSS